jgi:hypothetical protein
MSLGSTQPLREICTRNPPGVKEWPVFKIDNSPPSVGRISGKCGSLHISIQWSFPAYYSNNIYYLLSTIRRKLANWMASRLKSLGFLPLDVSKIFCDESTVVNEEDLHQGNADDY